jgi:hypothetical protein
MSEKFWLGCRACCVRDNAVNIKVNTFQRFCGTINIGNVKSEPCC